MIYEHVCQMPKCYEIVERTKPTGNFTCYKCKAKRIKLANLLSYNKKNTHHKGTSSYLV